MVKQEHLGTLGQCMNWYRDGRRTVLSLEVVPTMPIVTYQPVGPMAPGGILVSSLFDQVHGQAKHRIMFTKCNKRSLWLPEPLP